nr:aminopeptidase [Aerosticca soli]
MMALLPACSDLRYFAHVARGQAGLVLHRRPIERVIADPHTDPELARRLALALAARRFASAALALPDNASYTSYVELHRPYVVWNVFVTPPYAVEPRLNCFPIAGCVAYRGFFDPAYAQDWTSRWRRQGDDVWIDGVSAYSTLGWFADPILSSMLRWDDDELAGTIFHELAHQRLYVKDDTAFNESFASFVEEEGLRAWHAARGLPPPDERARAMQDAFAALVLDLRERLRAAYARGGSEAELAAAKAAEIAAFRARYARWRDREWGGDHRYDAWVAAPINNARLVPFGLYDRWKGAFAALFVRCGRHWPDFYAAAGQLARESAAARQQALEALRAVASGDAPRRPMSTPPP